MEVFVASPIGAPKSSVRERSDRLLRHVVVPACRDFNLAVVRADKLNRPGRITEQVTEHLTSAAIVIADVTGLNANVMFEVGVRAGLQRPFVLLARRGQQLPFDLKDLRTIFYSLDLDGAETARVELKEQIADVLTSAARATSKIPLAADAPLAEKDIQLAFQSVGNYLERVKRTKGLTRIGFGYQNRFRQVRLRGGKLGIALTFD